MIIRPLSVRIPGHPDWKLRFRRGYQPGGAPSPAAGTNPLAALSSHIRRRCLPESKLGC